MSLFVASAHVNTERLKRVLIVMRTAVDKAQLSMVSRSMKERLFAEEMIEKRINFILRS